MAQTEHPTTVLMQVGDGRVIHLAAETIGKPDPVFGRSVCGLFGDVLYTDLNTDPRPICRRCAWLEDHE